MQLTSGYFLLFFAVLLALYYVLPKGCQKPMLLVGSLLFYACSSLANLVLIVCMSLLAYGGARLLCDRSLRLEQALSAQDFPDKAARKAYRRRAQRQQRVMMLVVVGLLLGCLTSFKILPMMQRREIAGVSSILLPMGLSFFTFQMVGYVLDVYRGSVQGERSLFRFLLFSCYFPQMVQGPISRYTELSPTLFAKADFDGKLVSAGLFRAVLGFLKKMVIADTVAVAVGVLAKDANQYAGGGVFLLLLLYSIQIYADFTGGMDIALGCSEMLGIRLRENFDHPFSSASVKEYWRRWHISMGRWFTDYVFYPLSVSKCSQKLSRYSRRLLGEAVGKRIPVWVATLLTWAFTGIWHGFGWNFLLWGLLNGVTILISQELLPLKRSFLQRHPRYAQSVWHRWACCIGVFLLMGLYRTLDVYKNVPMALAGWGSLIRISAWKSIFSSAFWSALGLSLPQWGIVLLGVGGMFLLGRVTKIDTDAAAAKWAGSTLAWGEQWRARLVEHPIRLALLLAGMISAIVIFGQYGYGYDASSFIYNGF